jgi:hypothetical protein
MRALTILTVGVLVLECRATSLDHHAAVDHKGYLRLRSLVREGDRVGGLSNAALRDGVETV